MSQQLEEMHSTCVVCSGPDDANMLTCSICLGGYHRICCNAEENADTWTWICLICSASQQSSGNLTTGISVQPHQAADQQTSAQQSTCVTGNVPTTELSVSQRLELQQLEEEMQLRQEFLQRKYALLRSNTSGASEMQNVRPVCGREVNTCQNSTPSVHRQNTVSIGGMQNRGELSNIAGAQTFNASAENNCDYNTQTTPQVTQDTMNRYCEYLAQAHTPQGQSTNIHHSNDHPLNIPQGANQNNERSCQNCCVTENVNIGSNSINLTTTQLVARQCISKDLPSFSGDAREWAIFISAFEHSTNIAGYNNEENIIRLQKCLQGKAREVVRNCLMLPDMVPDIIRTLKMYFGRPEYILKSLTDDVRKITVHRGKLESLIEFAFAVKHICATIRASNLNEYIANPSLLQELVDKLPPETLLQWAMHAKDIPRPNLTHLSDWLYSIAEATCRVTVPTFTTDERKSTKRDGRLNTHIASSAKDKQTCIICNDDHRVIECAKFKDMSIADRWNVVKDNKLCRICCGKHRRRCWVEKRCGVNGCMVMHNALLHEEGSFVSSLNNHRPEGESFFRIVPVKLFNGNKSVTIHALMDDGSTLTLIEESVARALGVKGISDPLCLSWTGGVSRYETNSQRFDLKISSTKSNTKVFPINNVHTVEHLNLPTETLIVDSLKKKYSHLRTIPLEGYEMVTPSMIIGVNNPNLISAIRTVEGEWSQPVETKTRLGWAVFGGGMRVSVKLNFHKCCCNEVTGIIENYLINENIGIAQPMTTPLSNEDQQAISVLEKTYKFIDDRYEVGLLWKADPPEMPDSLPTARKRLKCIQRRADQDSELAKMIQDQILNLEQKGYANRLPLDALNSQEEKVWYLPTFIVKNPNKPGKLLLVWDAAAKSGGFSLNDFLLKGPDLLIPLMTILFKFRIGAVAICGDIAEMFHRIKVRKEEAKAQRFLWWDEDNDVIVYQLNVLTFGASCSSFISHYIRDKNAHNFAGESKVIEAITKQHYVDDYIDSVASVDEAIDLAIKVRDTHAKGGFHMRNWSSNSPAVLSALGENKPMEDKSFTDDKPTQFEKILGLYWDPCNDIFKMNLKFVRLRRPILTEDIVPTKRELLQVLMSVFDPLGFVACFMSCLKVILQEVWRNRIEWDETLSDHLNQKWKSWLKFLPIITDVSIPRCYSMAFQNQNYSVDLHVFVDASEEAYAAVAYFRIESEGSVEVRLVAAKSKVAPLQPLSVPRLELHAAVIGAGLSNTVSGQGIHIKQKILWTDSKTVLSWLNGDPRKYKQFVMFRIAEIIKLTKVSEWRWIPSSKNVADYATKYRSTSNNYDEWFHGPSWFLLPETEWATQTFKPYVDDTHITELRPRYLHCHTRTSHKLSFNFDYFSSWYRLCRGVCNWFICVERLQNKCRNHTTNTTIQASHWESAKQAIYKNVQELSFPDEYAAVQFNKPIAKDGILGKLNVYMDKGVVKVKNRAQYASSICGYQRDFIVLPGNHHVTKLIVNNFHIAYHHLNHETVLNEIRQIYFIPKLRVLYRIVRKTCQKCKNEAAKPTSPQMSPLPPARLGAFQRPFTFVGVDYFGPISITSGRKSLKRWGVLLTCLTIRAVHIEIAHTLSTDSFLMALRSFIARRGMPAEIYSDNGTQFKGADRFLRAELETLDIASIQSNLASRGISWKFNPPAAPHMGGAWERLVRSVKTILYKISPSHKFTEESLRSALAEVELIVNSRPLTYVSLDSEDQEAITPNHFLLGSSNGAKPFSKLENVDHKTCLYHSEKFANLFWHRFVKEMLPTLTRRAKWSQRVKPIEVGDVVLIVDENAERNVWLNGKVVEVTTAKDGQVRRAHVKTKNGIMERPAVKLAVLDVGNAIE